VNCVIPHSDDAISQVDKALGVNRGRDYGNSSNHGPKFDTTCDVNGCVLDGVTATGCTWGGVWPNCYAQPSSLAQMQCGAMDPYCSGGGGGSDTGWTTYGSGSTPDPGDGNAFNQGPLLWGGCVLGVIGSGLSIYQVADAFQSWYDSYQAAEGAYNIWQATVTNHADPLTRQLYEYEYRQARQRQEDMKGAVASATNTSYVALGAAALACGALVLAPTP
jgi:hypothetical protein